MNLEQFKLASKEELKLYGLTIPLGTANNSNNELTFKDSTGFWYESTYDSTNELTYKTSSGFWCERTYDSNRNELTYKDSSGLDCIVLFKGTYTLYYNKTNNKYKAGCQELTYDECLAYYDRHSDKHEDADKILKAIKEHHNSLK